MTFPAVPSGKTRICKTTVPSHPASRAARGYSGRGLFTERTLERTEPVSATESRSSRVGPDEAAGRGRLTGTDSTRSANEASDSVGSGAESGAAAEDALVGDTADAGTRGRSLKFGGGSAATLSGSAGTTEEAPTGSTTG